MVQVVPTAVPLAIQTRSPLQMCSATSLAYRSCGGWACQNRHRQRPSADFEVRTGVSERPQQCLPPDPQKQGALRDRPLAAIA